MALVNFVLIIFWQHDALQRELARDLAVLDHVRSLAYQHLHSGTRIPSNLFSFETFYKYPETGRIFLYTGDKIGVVSAVAGLAPELLGDTITESLYANSEVYHYSGSLLGIIRSRPQCIVVAAPLVFHDTVIGAVGIIRSMEPLFSLLRQREKLVLIYILANVLFWSLVGFFRLRAVVLRPIERLVQLADQYTDQDAHVFAAESPTSEFALLANSLNTMLNRIKHDRQSLQKNIAELAEVNDRLTSQQQEMVRTEKLVSVGRMAAGLAHEIGNPLGVVQGYLDLLKQAYPRNSEYADYLRRAEQELQRVNGLIRQMLDFARVSRGSVENFSFHELLGSVIEMIRIQPLFKDIQLTLQAKAAQYTICADRNQLRQVIVNCLLNSADAVNAASLASAGAIILGTDIFVDEQAARPVKFLRLTINDNGIGISEEQITAIFDPFFTTKDPGKGTGLGLSVSISIIESLGGSMQMKSTPGVGSTLTILLPLAGTDNFEKIKLT